MKEISNSVKSLNHIKVYNQKSSKFKNAKSI